MTNPLKLLLTSQRISWHCCYVEIRFDVPMSTFSGFLDEIENVSIDRFTQANFVSGAFFLSHCHMDHMIGLKEINPENELPGPLYLSEISQVIVNRRYPAVKNLVTLKVGGK